LGLYPPTPQTPPPPACSVSVLTFRFFQSTYFVCNMLKCYETVKLRCYQKINKQYRLPYNKYKIKQNVSCFHTNFNTQHIFSCFPSWFLSLNIKGNLISELNKLIFDTIVSFCKYFRALCITYTNIRLQLILISHTMLLIYRFHAFNVNELLVWYFTPTPTNTSVIPYQ